MTIVVTGAAGFIGANIVKALNARGEREIIAVDNLANAAKVANLADCDVADYLDKAEFLARVEAGDFDTDIDLVLHEGACSDTLETDGRYVMQNNYRYSVTLLDYCQDNDIPFIYASSASVYGAGTTFRESREFEAPLNVYGYSKFLFDQYVRGVMAERTAQIAGFRYFNVYGPREAHKRGRGSSIAFNAYEQYRDAGRVRLFAGSGGYADGEQRRDFVSVEDVVAVNLAFVDHPQWSGIFNLGSGHASTFNAVAATTINTCDAARGEPPRTLAELVAAGAIEYVPMPTALEGKYQSFTEADLSRLRAAGYAAPMLPVEEGVRRYVEWLISRDKAAA
ncbi:MAG TPA: ADP-glyceromanno-heptose 6-epimerase [Casimicrobiaceae bacterium]|jgi:ADP-L-glycero-D-manno-heptose 6-epimerase|nr:ADP-glyceromanno-heptose 6-epimerase [Casimicrobiaceae bacterium]